MADVSDPHSFYEHIYLIGGLKENCVGYSTEDKGTNFWCRCITLIHRTWLNDFNNPKKYKIIINTIIQWLNNNNENNKISKLN